MKERMRRLPSGRRIIDNASCIAVVLIVEIIDELSIHLPFADIFVPMTD